MAGIEYQKYIIQKFSSSFEESTVLVKCTTEEPPHGKLLIKNKFLGVNAADLLLCKGRFGSGSPGDLGVGLEGMGVVSAIGKDCLDFSVGDYVGYVDLDLGSYGEYATVSSSTVFKLPSDDPNFIGLLVSGLTAKICFDETDSLKTGENVMISAAAGGAGQFAVQLAKLAGCHVIGLCSSDKKAEFLRKIGCDITVDYKKDDLKMFLKEEYPNGIDVAFETVGSGVFDAALSNIAIHGRILRLGTISNYLSSEGAAKPLTPEMKKILKVRSATVTWFGVLNYAALFKSAFGELVNLFKQGKLQVHLDNGSATSGGKFVGLQALPRALDHLYGRQNIGKVFVGL